MKLVTMMAKACSYAQEHIDDLAAWPQREDQREWLLQCTSFQMACFLAQNTKEGDGGVDWNVIIEELVEHPMKSEKEWVKILEEKAKFYGGWKRGVK